MSLRTSAAVAAVRLVNGASRVSGKGSGTVAGGRVGLKIAPDLLGVLSTGRRVALVSGTNGKTTTTALLAAAASGIAGEVATNATGSNMPPGHVAALVGTQKAKMACLEVDEAYLGAVAQTTSPEVIVLLNLSRDQLDRMNEVRMLAERWRAFLETSTATIIANADDPLVVYAAVTSPKVVWVAGGLSWRDDAGACPSCRGAITFQDDGPGWRCTACDLSRPAPAWDLDSTSAQGPGGSVGLELSIPGEFNRHNGLMALAAAVTLGANEAEAAHAMGDVSDVAGRFVERSFGAVEARLMLAKNPAGWSSLLEVVAGGDGPVVVSINARTADGADPSWLFDVDFSVLAGRLVVATGDRSRDLSVRLRYGRVDHTRIADPLEAVALAGAEGKSVEVIGNYTAFRDLLEAQ